MIFIKSDLFQFKSNNFLIKIGPFLIKIVGQCQNLLNYYQKWVDLIKSQSYLTILIICSIFNLKSQTMPFIGQIGTHFNWFKCPGRSNRLSLVFWYAQNKESFLPVIPFYLKKTSILVLSPKKVNITVEKVVRSGKRSFLVTTIDNP